VFVSHTSELREFPGGGSYVAAVERAISACGHVIVDMADFPAANLPPAELCAERVRGCQVYVGVLGTRYGSLVADRPELSYTELEFEAATGAGLDRLVFVLDTGAENVGIPLDRLIDLDFGARQQAFRYQVQESGLVTKSFTDPATLGQLVERSLRELAERHRRADSGGAGGQAAVVVAGEIPQEPVGFQPRLDLLAVLDAPGAGPRVVRAMTGMRGVGKTHLAAAYARAKLDDGWRLVAWVNAEDEGALLAGLAEAAAGLGLAAGDAETAGKAVRHWLEADGERCLLVFDNATDPRVLRPFLPAGGQARVVITSNRQSVAALGLGVLVDVFTEAEALTFLAARTGLADAAGAGALAAELGCLPLALAQAAAVIAAQLLTYDTYLGRLRRLPAADLLVAEEAGDYPQGVAAAVLLSVETVRAGADGRACGAVLDLLAVLSPSGVRRSLVHAAAAAGLPGREGTLTALKAEAADRMLARLAGVSLVTFSLDGTTVTAHRLVMRVIRENLAAAGQLTAACQAAARLLGAQNATLTERWHQDRAAVRDLVEQITVLAEAADRCPADDSLDRAITGLRWSALWYLNELGDNPLQAIAIGERLAADRDRLLGPDHPDTLASRNSLAIAYQDAGRTAEAIALEEQVLVAYERVLGLYHPSTLSSLGNLANAYQAAGRTADAITLDVQTLAAYERVLGPEHPSTLGSRSNLAAAYQDAGRTAEAITLHEQNLAARERVLGPDHPSTLTSRGNLAAAYRDAGRTADAITLHEQSLAARERVLGPDHPHALTSRGNLAAAYRDAGRVAEAITLYEQNLAARVRVLGPAHISTVTSRRNLAAAYRDAGRTAEAVTLYEQNLAVRVRVLGPGHPSTLTSRRNLAAAYRDAGRTAEAVTIYEQDLAVRVRVLGADHLSTLSSRGNLAAAYRDAGRMAEAITLYEQNLAARVRVLGADHLSTLSSRGNLAAAYRDAGRMAEAITLYEQNLAARVRILGADHLSTLSSRGNLAAAYQAAGRMAEAITLYEQNLAARERILGPGHAHTLLSRSNLAVAYEDTGRTAEATSLYKQVLAAYKLVLGPGQPDPLGSRGNISAAYQDASRNAGAKKPKP
jgi:tetratricopeptide (TPR) repeat protein